MFGMYKANCRSNDCERRFFIVKSLDIIWSSLIVSTHLQGVFKECPQDVEWKLGESFLDLLNNVCTADVNQIWPIFTWVES